MLDHRGMAHAGGSPLGPVIQASLPARAADTTFSTVALDAPAKAQQVLVVARGRLFREALQRLLQNLGLVVAAEAVDIGDVLDDGPAAPDLVIWSLEPDEADLEAHQIRRACERFSHSKVILLADCLSPAGVGAAVQTGVSAILSKDISGEVLKRSLDLVSLGQRFFPASVTASLLEHGGISQEHPLPPASLRPPAFPVSSVAVKTQRAVILSDREKQILQCLVSGASNKIIARQLVIAEATVKVHVKALLRKVQAVNRTQAAIWAMHNGVDLEAADPPALLLPAD